MSRIIDMDISIPSLSEQNKTVATLDKFEILLNSLTNGLPKEISLRHQQYEYFRNALLKFKEENA
jgi:type I restriction enzyme S subunit